MHPPPVRTTAPARFAPALLAKNKMTLRKSSSLPILSRGISFAPRVPSCLGFLLAAMEGMFSVISPGKNPEAMVLTRVLYEANQVDSCFAN